VAALVHNEAQWALKAIGKKGERRRVNLLTLNDIASAVNIQQSQENRIFKPF